MILLTSTSQVLKISLNASASPGLSFFASYIDTTGTATTPGNSVGTVDSTSEVTLVAAPASSTQRLIKFINVINQDDTTQTVNVKFYNGSTYGLIAVNLAIGDHLIYEDGSGWKALNNNGELKVSR